MSDFDIERHQIYVAVMDKYNNKIFPQLPLLIIPYLLENREKAVLYLNKKISVRKLLKHINKLTKTKKEFNFMEEIINYVEVINA